MMMFAGAAMQLVLATIARGFYDASCAPAGTLTLDALTMPVACREVLRAYGYAAYLFFDFAGYSLMAMGLGRCFGIAVPANFRAPYIAVDIKDFWNRWHITLSTWLRDFVFMRFVRMAYQAQALFEQDADGVRRLHGRHGAYGGLARIDGGLPCVRYLSRCPARGDGGLPKAQLIP